MVPIMPRNAKLRSHSAFFPKKLMSSNNAATAISHNKFSGCSTVVLAFPTILYPNLFLFPCKNVFRFPPCQVYFSFFVPILLTERTVNVMKIFFSQADASPEIIEEDFSPIDLKESIRKTRQALEIAYAGFDNALESDLIDSYIYEINALQKRYQHLTELAALQPADQEKNLYQHSPIRALVSHVFG